MTLFLPSPQLMVSTQVARDQTTAPSRHDLYCDGIGKRTDVFLESSCTDPYDVPGTLAYDGRSKKLHLVLSLFAFLRTNPSVFTRRTPP